MDRKVRVLVVDDSSIFRQMLKLILSRDSAIEVVGAAPDPYVARDLIVKLRPDVVTLDVEMPRMDGITFLEKLMQHNPLPVVIVSSLTQKGSETALRALETGAVAVVGKPIIDIPQQLEERSAEIINTVKAAAGAKLLRFQAGPALRQVSSSKPVATVLAETTHKLIGIASSTGGTEALIALLTRFPAEIPPTLIVQHMPPVFTASFAKRVQEMVSFEFREARDGERLRAGVALIAPGNFHLEVTKDGAYYAVRLHQEPAMHGVRPAADYLFRTMAKFGGKNCVGIVLTGMGKDGAQGLKAMHDAGAFTIAQNEETCVVFGMPKAAIEAGGIDKVLPLPDIAGAAFAEVKRRAIA